MDVVNEAKTLTWAANPKWEQLEKLADRLGVPDAGEGFVEVVVHSGDRKINVLAVMNALLDKLEEQSR